jgi:hypothetical protein
MTGFILYAVIYLAAAVVCVPIAKKLGMGSVLGYILAGIIIGPFVLGFIGEEGGDIMHFAEFGVVDDAIPRWTGTRPFKIMDPSQIYYRNGNHAAGFHCRSNLWLEPFVRTQLANIVGNQPGNSHVFNSNSSYSHSKKKASSNLLLAGLHLQYYYFRIFPLFRYSHSFHYWQQRMLMTLPRIIYYRVFHPG